MPLVNVRGTKAGPPIWKLTQPSKGQTTRASTRVCAVGMKKRLDFRKICEIESGRSGDLSGCGDQVETHQSDTQISAPGGGASSPAEERVCGRRRELQLQTRGVRERDKLSWSCPPSAGPAQPLDHLLSLWKTTFITISGDFTSNMYLSVL